MPVKILLVGSEHDLQTAHQIRAFQKHGSDIHVIQPDLPPNDVEFSWSSNGIAINGKEVGNIDAAFIRSLPPSYLSADLFSQPLDWPSYFQQYCLQRDRSDTLLSLLLSIEANGVPCWNPPSRALLMRRKPHQLDVMRSLGCSVPETLITNNPDDAVAFLKQYPDSIVKPAAGGALTLNPSEISAELLEQIRIAPAIFQQRIRGDDIRVIVVGDQVVSTACILVPPDTLDFRGDNEYSRGNIKYEELELPEKVKQDAVLICRALGYRYGGIDLKRSKENHFVFLECNNSPIYLDVENKLGHPITETLVRQILNSA